MSHGSRINIFICSFDKFYFAMQYRQWCGRENAVATLLFDVAPKYLAFL